MACEEQVGPDGDALPEELKLPAGQVPRGAEVALLIELAVVRQVALGHHAQQPAAVYHDRGVEQAALGAQRRAHHHHRAEAGTLGHDAVERAQHPFGQRLLVVEVLDRIRGEPELRKDHSCRVRVGSLARQLERPLGVEAGLRHPHARDPSRDPHEAVAVEGFERPWSRLRRPTHSS